MAELKLKMYIMHQVTFFISAQPPECAFQLTQLFPPLDKLSKKHPSDFLYVVY